MKSSKTWNTNFSEQSAQSIPLGSTELQVQCLGSLVEKYEEVLAQRQIGNEGKVVSVFSNRRKMRKLGFVRGIFSLHLISLKQPFGQCYKKVQIIILV
jgi:hypothetical protein